MTNDCSRELLYRSSLLPIDIRNNTFSIYSFLINEHQDFSMPAVLMNPLWWLHRKHELDERPQRRTIVISNADSKVMKLQLKLLPFTHISHFVVSSDIRLLLHRCLTPFYPRNKTFSNERIFESKNIKLRSVYLNHIFGWLYFRNGFSSFNT